MAPHTAALQHCFDEVADSAPMALERCLNRVITVLQDGEGASLTASERHEFGDAWRELSRHQAAWCKRYPDELRAAFIAARATTDEQSLAGPAAHAPAPELTLVEDVDILEAIESSRLVHHVMPMVEEPVSELDALVSSAMGLDTVRPDLNPIRPEVFARTLRALIGRTQVKAATGSLWMKYMAEPLGHELQDLYGRLVTQLRDANVHAAQYRLVQDSRGGRRAGTSAAGSDEVPAHANTAPTLSSEHYASLSNRQISHALLRDFLANGGGEQSSQALPDSYYAEVERELDALANRSEVDGAVSRPAQIPAGYREMPPVDRPQRAVGIQSTLNSQVWGNYAISHERSLVRSRLRKDATHVAQVLGLELVRKVVDQIAQDPRLLAPVREAIVALEPSLLRLAMIDPRFFSEEHHPGRRLMERVAQRSFKYNDEFSIEFAGFFGSVTGAFKELNQATIEDTRPFEDALRGLEATWTDQDRLEEEERGQAVDAMRFAELRQAEADRIAWELSSRPDLDAVPAVVQDFLFGPWALAMAQARLTDKDRQIDPHGYRSVISDLLWSVKREVTLRQPAQLFERVPRMVATLRAGLASLGQQPEDNEEFFQALMKLHHPVLKLRRAKSRRDARESGLTPLAAVDTTVAPAAAAPAKVVEGQPWMSPHELDAAGFEETLPSENAGLMAEPTESGSAPLSTRSEAGELPAARAATTIEAEPSGSAGIDSESIMANLREGDWVDLYSKHRWLRAQLIWASTRGTLFMFVSHGGRPHSMTKRVCERLIRQRYLRPVRMHGVVAQALGTLDREPAAS